MKVSVAGTTATFTPDADFAYSAAYQATVTVCDDFVQSSFSTLSEPLDTSTLLERVYTLNLADADWNELVDILKHRLADALQDVVGNGSPRHRSVVNNDTTPPKLDWGHVYVDGVRVIRDNASSNESIDNFVHPSEIAGVEVYRSASEVPAEFGGSVGRCGAIVIWTGSGGGG